MSGLGTRPGLGWLVVAIVAALLALPVVAAAQAPPAST